MTVTSVIPETPAATPSRSSSSPSRNNQSKDFYSYLRSSTHDSDEASHSVHERTQDSHKQEKRTNKAKDKDGSTDTNSTSTQLQPNEQPVKPPLSIEVLLGLMVAPKTDDTQTAKGAIDDGKTVTPVIDAADSQSGAKSAESLPAVKFISSSNALSSFKATRADEDNKSNTDSPINPALLFSPVTPQLLNITANATDDGQTNPIDATGGAPGNEGELKNVEMLMAGNSSSDTAPNTEQGNLAFALRLSDNGPGVKAEQHSPQASSMESAASIEASGNTDLMIAVKAADNSQLKEQSHQNQSQSEANLYQVPQTQSQNISESTHHIQEQPTPAIAADLLAKQDGASTEPVRNVHVQLVGDNNNRVDVRLMDRGGELHVSVKSGDANLAQNLQNHMPELTSRLEQQKFQTEVWMPTIRDSAKAEMSGARDFSSGGNNTSGNSDNSSDKQGKGQQQYKPDWVDVLENSTRGAGKVNPTWQQ